MLCLVFPANYCYIHFKYVNGEWKNIFQKVKRPHTQLLMSFSSIENMVGYLF